MGLKLFTDDNIVEHILTFTRDLLFHLQKSVFEEKMKREGVMAFGRQEKLS